MEYRGVVSFVSFIFVVVVVYAEDNAGHLARVVNELQNQVQALQQARHEDQTTIRDLQDKLKSRFGVSVDDWQRTSPSFEDDQALEMPSISTTASPIQDVVVARVLSSRTDLDSNKDDWSSNSVRAIRVLEKESENLGRLDAQLKQLRDDIAETVKVKDREITAAENVAEFRLEADSLRDELLRVKRDLEELKAKHREEEIALKRAKNGQVTVQWLQKTVEDLRREMTELASSVNVSATMGERQRDRASLDLARLDIIDLRKRLDTVHVKQERDAAWVGQMKEDMQELRSKLQILAAGHQRLTHEVAELKEEFNERVADTPSEDMGIKDRYKREASVRQHLKRHHGHWKAEIEELEKDMVSLKRFKNSLRYEIRNLKDGQGDLTDKVSNLEVVSTDLMNRSANLGVEQRAMSQQVEAIQHQMDQQEKQADDLKSTVNNITETGIKKLHASTIQLFKTLENLEDSYDKSMEDSKKEMSKMEFNLAQAQSTLSELREEQTTYEHTLKSMRTDVKKVQMESKRDHYRMLSLRSDVLNKTLQDSKLYHLDAVREVRISNLESKIASLSKTVDGERSEVDNLHRQVADKADTTDLSRWQRTQDRLREIVLNVSGSIPSITKEETELQKEMDKFVKQLPKDCSTTLGNEPRKSGVLLIQAPMGGISSKRATATRVYCDMDIAGGQWLLIQRRIDGQQNFNQNWAKYKEGFGDVRGDFWLGNEIVHRLTTDGNYKLRIDLWDAAGRYKFAEYDTFRVLQESDGYRLAIAGYKGNASDALGYHNGMAFSTPDRDNDASMATHCGQFYGSGWWYNHCQYVNINGRYSTGVTWYDIDGQEWSELTRVEMKIRPVTTTNV